jgi:hypothetical protein
MLSIIPMVGFDSTATLGMRAEDSHETSKSFVMSPEKLLTFENRPPAALRNFRDVRVGIIASRLGFCGTEAFMPPCMHRVYPNELQVHYWQNGRIGQYIVKNSIVLGHESAGIVEAIGKDVKDPSVGDEFLQSLE